MHVNNDDLDVDAVLALTTGRRGMHFDALHTQSVEHELSGRKDVFDDCVHTIDCTPDSKTSVEHVQSNGSVEIKKIHSVPTSAR